MNPDTRKVYEFTANKKVLMDEGCRATFEATNEWWDSEIFFWEDKGTNGDLAAGIIVFETENLIAAVAEYGYSRPVWFRDANLVRDLLRVCRNQVQAADHRERMIAQREP